MAPTAMLTVESTAANVRTARHFATRLADLVLPDDRVLTPSDVQALALMVSELVGNAVEHGDGAVTVDVTSTGSRIRVEITDGGEGVPERRCVWPDTPTGRGLGIVDALASSWGWEGRPDGGKAVWFEY